MILQGDCLEVMRGLEGESVNCCVTSPPYYGLRDYGVDGQIGLERTPEEYIAKMVEVFREVWRLLKKDGTLWINIGDSYANDGKWGGHTGGKHAKALHDTPIGRNKKHTGFKPKDLMGIPWMLAFALRADGWFLRQDIIWAKPNPMPESVKDRCTKSHEYVFLLSKSQRYYFDGAAIQEPVTGSTVERLSQDIENQAGSDRAHGKPMKAVAGKGNANGFRGGAYCNHQTFTNNTGGKRKTPGNIKIPSGWDTGPGDHGSFHKDGRTPSAGSGRQLPQEGALTTRNTGVGFGHGTDKEERNRERISATKSKGIYVPTGMRNKRDVWTVATQSFREAHFATFPKELVRPCILAGCPQGGTALDPFFGSGTVGEVCIELCRNWVGIELKPQYCEMATRRTDTAYEGSYYQKLI